MNEKEIKNNNIADDDPDDYRVTLELDDGTTAECAIMTILEVGDQDYIVLIPWTKTTNPLRKARFSSTATLRTRTAIPHLTTSTMRKSLNACPNALMNFWTSRNSVSCRNRGIFTVSSRPEHLSGAPLQPDFLARLKIWTQRRLYCRTSYCA